MKTPIKIVIFIAISLVMMQCKEKEPIENEPVNNDYRKEYLGNYLCIRTGSGNDTTLVISVSKVKDSMISILDFAAIVDQNGNFYKDSISFMTCKGGLGSYWCCHYNGEKL